MTAAPKEKDMNHLPRAVVLGAGASRGVSYAHESSHHRLIQIF